MDDDHGWHDSDKDLDDRVAAAEAMDGDRLSELETLAADLQAALNERESSPSGQ